MKKILLLWFSVLFTNFLMAQSITAYTSSPNTEVGIANMFNFTLNPGASAGNTHYRVDNWLVIANIGSGTIAGNINGQSSSNYYYNPPANEIIALSDTKGMSISVTYGSNAPDTDNMEVQVSGFYGIMDNGVFVAKNALNGKYKKSDGTSGYTVDVKTVCGPAISSPTILACSTANVQICASNYCDANSFAWSITGGTIISGQGSSCITVHPTSNDDVAATCIAKRSSGLSSYTATNTKTVTRTARTFSLVTNPVQDYICKDSGLVFQYADQSGLSSVTWNAPNCTVSAESIVNGMRQVTYLS